MSLLDTGTIEWTTAKPPATVEEFAAAYEQGAADVDARLARLEEAGWRGQLSTYLRPMGGKVPAIYGPSADDAGQG